MQYIPCMRDEWWLVRSLWLHLLDMASEKRKAPAFPTSLVRGVRLHHRSLARARVQATKQGKLHGISRPAKIPTTNHTLNLLCGAHGSIPAMWYFRFLSNVPVIAAALTILKRKKSISPQLWNCLLYPPNFSKPVKLPLKWRIYYNKLGFATVTMGLLCFFLFIYFGWIFEKS
jgi:hypothetical protein